MQIYKIIKINTLDIKFIFKTYLKILKTFLSFKQTFIL